MTHASTVIDPARVLSRVREVLGPERSGGREGTPLATPSSAEETAALLRVAGEEGWRVLPVGNGIGEGLRPAAPKTSPHLRLSTVRMAGILDHEPADLTVQAGAGITLGALQDGVAGAGQWLALDPPGGPEITLGGVVAMGTAGPLRVSHGKPRDQLLGLTMIDGAGKVLSLGGRVVKNVAGFDLVRLATGSRGALGVVTEVTFRLYPLPEEDRTLIWTHTTGEEAWDFGRQLALLPLPLGAAELVAGERSAPLDGSGVRVALRLLGSAAAVSRMRERLLEEVGLPVKELEGVDSRRAAALLAADDGAGPVAFRAHSLPDRGRGIAAALAETPIRHAALHLLQGSLRGTLRPDAEPESLEPMSRAARLAGGSLRVLRAPGVVPEGIEEGIDRSPALARLYAGITRGFDPAGVLPGSWREGWT